jgi:uncharacterized protein GlcG (DUF336 family)
MRIDSARAEAAIKAAVAKAAEIGVAACLAVLDDAGHLVSFSRMDGAWLGSIDVALGKAKTSVLFEAETQIIGEVSQPGAQAHGLDSTNGGLVTFAGGIPLKDVGGKLIGAIGVSGGQVAQDHDIARAGAAAFSRRQSPAG